MSGLVKLDGWRDWWWLGRKVVFELNMTSPCRHIQPVADITYLLKVLNLRKKHLPEKDEVMVLLSRQLDLPQQCIFSTKDSN